MNMVSGICFNVTYNLKLVAEWKRDRQLDREFCSSVKDISVAVNSIQLVLKSMGMKSPRECLEV